MPRRFSSSAVSKDSEGAAFTLLHPHCLSLPPTVELHSWDSLLVAGTSVGSVWSTSFHFGEKKKNGASIRKPSVWRRSVSCFWEGGWLLYVNTDGAWTPERFSPVSRFLILVHVFLRVRNVLHLLTMHRHDAQLILPALLVLQPHPPPPR